MFKFFILYTSIGICDNLYNIMIKSPKVAVLKQKYHMILIDGQRLKQTTTHT